MKNTIIGICLLLPSFSVAVPMEFFLNPVEKNTAVDCESFTQFLLESAALSADEAEFARTLPLAGQMKDFYEVHFTADEIPGPIEKLEVEITGGALTQMTDRLGLKPELPVFANGKLTIKTRDLACDFLSGAVRLKGQVRAALSPEPVYVKQARTLADEVLSSGESDQVKAARLGFRFGEWTGPQIHFLFDTLFLENTLVLRTKAVAEQTVVLSVLEKKLARYGKKSFAALTPGERKNYRYLVFRRAAVLKGEIFRKYGR